MWWPDQQHSSFAGGKNTRFVTASKLPLMALKVRQARPRKEIRLFEKIAQYKRLGWQAWSFHRPCSAFAADEGKVAEVPDVRFLSLGQIEKDGNEWRIRYRYPAFRRYQERRFW